MAIFHLFIFTIITTLIAGCNRSNEKAEPDKQTGGSVTIWTTKSELFMEHPALIVGEEIRFAVHLTWLSNFKPVTAGKLSLEFSSDDGHRRVASEEKPASAGIYRPIVKFDRPGTYHLTMTIDGAVRDTLHVEGLHVYASASDARTEEDAVVGEQQIIFLKEQQWKIDFRTEPVLRKSLSGTLRAACEIVPRVNSEAIVCAPFTGTIQIDQNPMLPVVGAYVIRHTRLVQMLPSAETPGGSENFASRFVEARTEREIARQDLSRAKRLFDTQIISEKEYQYAEAAFKRADATLTLLSKNIQSNEEDADEEVFTLKAPLTGTIVEAHVVPGKHVDAGEPLYRIIDTRSVWIRASIPSTEIGKLTRPNRAWLYAAGDDNPFAIDEQNGKLVSIASAIDPTTRTFPVIFEVRNTDEKLRIGMFGEIIIATGKEKEALVVPESALLEEEGRYSVFVHSEGEAFIKRDVTLGDRNGNFVEIQSGLSAGERVVTVGAYQVRLASLSSEIPVHGHTH